MEIREITMPHNLNGMLFMLLTVCRLRELQELMRPGTLPMATTCTIVRPTGKVNVEMVNVVLMGKLIYLATVHLRDFIRINALKTMS